METAATNTRNFRTFLLMAHLEARAIGSRIKQARKEAGMTQEQVADVATFSVRSLQDPGVPPLPHHPMGREW